MATNETTDSSNSIPVRPAGLAGAAGAGAKKSLPPRPATASPGQGGATKPERPGRPSAAATAPAVPASKAPAAVQKKAAAAQTKQAQAEAQEAEPAEEAEGSALSEYLRQSPAWLTSMVIHMILLLVLALITFKITLDDPQELVIGNTEEQVEDINEEEPEDALNEHLDVEVDSVVAENIENFSEVNFDVPDVQEIPNENDELELAAVQVEFNPLATLQAKTGDMLSEVQGGVSDKGMGGRNASGRAAGVRRSGGTKGSEAAVELALKWIAAHQNPDGSWDYRLPNGPCAVANCAGKGSVNAQHAATGMALLAFLGAGYTHKAGKYEKTVGDGLSWLVRNMKVNGNMGDLQDGGHAGMYAHGIAAMALTEAYGMSQDEKLMAPAQMAINFIAYAQGPDGGWRYGPKQAGDTSAVGWQIMALKSGHMAYLKIDPQVIQGAHKFLDKVQGDEYGGQYGYHTKGHKNTTSSIGALCRVYLGWPRDHQGLQAGAAWMMQAGPDLGGGGPKMYYDYYATQFMYQFTNGEGPMWNKWNTAMRDHLVQTQAKQGAAAGSWYFNTQDAWGARFYDTCLAAMTLEVYYRYMPVYKKGALKDGGGGGGAGDFPLD